MAVPAVISFQLLLAPVVPTTQLPLSKPVHFGASPAMLRVRKFPLVPNVPVWRLVRPVPTVKSVRLPEKLP